MSHAENRTKQIVVHTTQARQQFFRIHAAKQGMTMSTYAEKIINDVLSKVDDPNNPFIEAKNKQ
ncbi:hypothetical protein [Acinetobacter baumannii]|uniref:hypothetical protein n=1 Tax=Acinetobacter baumannii TaxID=470 RepID=UPI0012482AFC|nr:hypothetical protein [Acinetobacter baumannii]QEY03382.1 hypothetical protein ABCAM1_0854 [Acinetobacter baumannii]